MRLIISSVLLLLAGCAAQPRADEKTAYTDYWNCAFDAARPYVNDYSLSAQEAAMRGLAQCNPAYTQYRTAHERYVRSRVRPDGYEMATTLAQHGALQKRRELTRRMVAWIGDQRQ